MKFDNIYGAVNILIPEKNTLSNLLILVRALMPEGDLDRGK